MHLQIFLVNYAYFFSSLVVQVHPLHSLATPVLLLGRRCAGLAKDRTLLCSLSVVVLAVVLIAVIW